MKIFKYRQNFAYGPGEWEYRDMFSINEELLVEELHREYDWSDKYRGCDVEVIDAPAEYLEQRISDMDSSIKWANERKTKFSEALQNLRNSVTE